MNAIDLSSRENRLREMLQQGKQSGQPVAGALARLLDSGIPLTPLAALAVLATGAGLAESAMTPFHSLVYMVAILLTYQTSVDFGVAGGLSCAAGAITLLLLGSIFRTSADLAGFAREMPFDLMLFGCLGVLPGLAIVLERGRGKGAQQRVAELGEQVARLKTKLAAAERAQISAKKPEPDPRVRMREGMAFVNLARDLVVAGSGVDERARALLAAMETALGPASAMLFARATPGGPLGLREIRPRRALPQQPPLPDDHPLARALATPDAVTRLEPPVTLPSGPPALTLAVPVPDAAGQGALIVLAASDTADGVALAMLRMAAIAAGTQKRSSRD